MPVSPVAREVTRSVRTAEEISQAGLSFLQQFWPSLLVLTAPVLLAPLPLTVGTIESRCAYVVILMSVFWMTEALPLPVTALLPIFLFPLLGVLDVQRTCSNYMSDASFLLVGGLVLALAIEESNLHKRIAFSILLRFGSKPENLMLGFMVVTGFLSMWISNTATVAMMLPTTIAITDELLRNKHRERCSIRNRNHGHNGDCSCDAAAVAASASATSDNLTLMLTRLPIVEEEEPVVVVEQEPISNQSARSLPREINIVDPDECCCTRMVISPAGSSPRQSPEFLFAPADDRLRRRSSALSILFGHRLSVHRLSEAWMYPEHSELKHVETGTQTDDGTFNMDSQEFIQRTDEFSNRNNSPLVEIHRLSQSERRLYSGMLLSICYAANIGGSATLTGTGPNLVLRGQIEKIFGKANTGLNYLSWMEFALPSAVATLLLCWMWLQLVFICNWKLTSFSRPSSWTRKGSKCKTCNSEDRISQILRQKYDELGKMSFAEVSVLFLFVLLVTLWITREPGFLPGWGSLFQDAYVSDSCAVILITTVLFMFPKNYPNVVNWCSTISDEVHSKDRSSLLSWTSMQAKFPWGIVLLIGGGFAMSQGIIASGLSDTVGHTMSRALGKLSPTLICFVVILVVALLTETTSNTSTTNIALPLVISVAQSLAVSSCFSFMLPASNPSNAMVYGTGRVSISDMIVGGVIVNVFSIFALIININTWGSYRFGLNVFPEWAALEDVEYGGPLTANGTSCLNNN